MRKVRSSVTRTVHHRRSLPALGCGFLCVAFMRCSGFHLELLKVSLKVP
jgi:hypothetical protein